MSPRSEQRVQLLRSELEPDAHGGRDLYTINCDVEVLHVIAGSLTVRFVDRIGHRARRRRAHLPGSRAAHLAGGGRTGHGRVGAGAGTVERVGLTQVGRLPCRETASASRDCG